MAAPEPLLDVEGGRQTSGSLQAFDISPHASRDQLASPRQRLASGFSDSGSSSPRSEPAAGAREHWRKAALLCAGVLLAFLAAVSYPAELEPPAKRCLALTVFVAWCWVVEPMPAHCTALLVPLLITVMGVLRTPGLGPTDVLPLVSGTTHCHPVAPWLPGQPIDPDAQFVCVPNEELTKAESAIVASMAFFDPIIWLFLSGFLIAHALEVVGISGAVSNALVSFSGPRPSRLLGALMCLSLVASAVLSNVAASVLVVAVLRPIVRGLPGDPPPAWSRASLLGVAFSCNLGGMTTPIASPQNVLAALYLRRLAGPDFVVGFGEWCAFALPFCGLSLVLVWGYLRWAVRTGLPQGLPVQPAVSRRCCAFTRPTPMQVFVSAVVFLTVFMWCSFDMFEPTFGNMGIVGLIPIVAFISTGLVTPKDFNNLPWTVLILLGGGLSLGVAVQSSGLLDEVADCLANLIRHAPLWVQVSTFNLLFIVMSNFLSSTVCAIITYPVVIKVGIEFGHPQLFVMTCCLLTSGAMALPISSFPNANAASVQGTDGKPVLSPAVIRQHGAPVSFMLLLLMVSLGYLHATIIMGW